MAQILNVISLIVPANTRLLILVSLEAIIIAHLAQ
jgi:hypothetical protein